MSYAMLPAARVKEAAEKALEQVDPKACGLDDLQSWFGSLVALCQAVLADPRGNQEIAVDANDFTWIRKHYDFTDPRLIALHEHPSTTRAFAKG